MEQNNRNKKTGDGINPPGNLGAIFEKCNSTSSYYILKCTLGGVNYTLCGFKNKNHSGEEFSKEPLYYLFPYKPRNKEVNKEENYNE